MKPSHSSHPLSEAPARNITPVQPDNDLSLDDCPAAVRDSICGHLGSGHTEEIMHVRRVGHVHYLAEIKLPGTLERKLEIAEDGTVSMIADEMPVSDLPRPVKTALSSFITSGARFEGAERVSASRRYEYHVGLDIGDDVDLHLFLDERGVILRRYEVGDF